MELAAIVALVTAAAQLIPEVQKVVPIVQAMVNGEKITAAQQAQLWTAIATLEDQAAAKAAAIEGEKA